MADAFSIKTCHEPTGNTVIAKVTFCNGVRPSSGAATCRFQTASSMHIAAPEDGRTPLHFVLPTRQHVPLRARSVTLPDAVYSRGSEHQRLRFASAPAP